MQRIRLCAGRTPFSRGPHTQVAFENDHSHIDRLLSIGALCKKIDCRSQDRCGCAMKLPKSSSAVYQVVIFFVYAHLPKGCGLFSRRIVRVSEPLLHSAKVILHPDFRLGLRYRGGIITAVSKINRVKKYTMGRPISYIVPTLLSSDDRSAGAALILALRHVRGN